MLKKVIEDLKNVINNLSGKLIYIGNVKEELAIDIEKNKNIIYCDILGSAEGKGFGKNKKGKSLNMKDFRKYYKKNNINYIICDISDIKKHLPRFISTSIYICQNHIYIYGKKDIYDLDNLKKKYRRYNVNIMITEYSNDYILDIDVGNAKNNFFKDKMYYVIDIFGMLADKISDLIIN